MSSVKNTQLVRELKRSELRQLEEQNQSADMSTQETGEDADGQPVKMGKPVSNESDNRAVLFQFGKWDRETFTLDVNYPMSVFQAFGVAVSVFDEK